jgi:cytochrome P450
MTAPVDPAVTVGTDFDHHSPEFGRRPFETLDELRDRAPVSWSTAHDGFWVVTDHHLVVDGLADFTTFSSAEGPAIPRGPFGTRHIPVAVDPPAHPLYRRILNDWFSKAAVTAREPEIADLVRSTVADLARRGSWDFVSDLAEVTPGTVTLSILGWDRSRRAELMEVMARGLRNQASKEPAVVAENAQGNAWIRAQILAEAADRRSTPREDLMTVLAVEPVVDGRPLTDAELTDVVVFLLLAGFHTTSGALSALLVHLAQHPDERHMLEQQRELIPSAIEEIIRIYSPVTSLARIVTHDTQLGDVTMQAGDWVLFVNMAANHDPKAFADPLRVDLHRDRSKSVAFGWGVHRCLGLHLARLILRVEVETVFDLMPDYEIDLDRVRLTPHMGIGYFFLNVPAHRAVA